MSTAARVTPRGRSGADRIQQTRRTRRLLLTTAATLIAAGRSPSVSDVADAADVSRRTAYRYFPTQEQLLVEATLEGLRPVMESALAGAPAGRTDEDLEARVDALARHMQRLAVDHEALLRTMVRLTVGRPRGSKDPPRGGRRLEWIDDAVRPVHRLIGRARYKRLVSALAVCLGIEALIVLRDICGLSPAQAEEVSRWTARAILKSSLADTEHRRRG
jgi:AcrR family transcriptional regulator